MPRSQQHTHKILRGYVKNSEIAARRRSHCLLCFNAGFNPDNGSENSLIRFFASHGTLLEASLLFCAVPKPSIHTWHAIIFAHAAHGHHDGVLELYQRMKEDGVRLNKYVFPCIIKACSTLGALWQGKHIHDDIMRYAVECDSMIGCALLDMYARCGSLAEARNLFDNLPSQDVVSWGAMMAGYSQHKHGFMALKLFEQMQEKGIEPTNITFLCVIKACGSNSTLIEGNLIHDYIVRLHYESDIAIGNALIDMHAKCGCLDAAQNIFDRLPTQNIVSYSTLLDAFVQHGNSFAALNFFKRMQSKNISSSTVTYLCVLKACCNVGALEPGMVLHNDIIVKDVEMDITVANTLIDMYAKCGFLEEARRVFDLLPRRSTISWSVMSSAYVQRGQNHCALELYDKMQQEQVKPDNGTYVSVLKACGNAGCTTRGMTIHKQIVNAGIALDTMLGSTLIDMYTKFGDLNEAEQVFSAFLDKDLVLWSALINAHLHHGKYLQALELFKRMQKNGVKPDRVVFLCAIKACRFLGAFHEGEMIHRLAKSHGFESDLIVSSALIDMYGKCGSMQSARKLFDRLQHRDAVAWGAIISGYAHNGDHEMVKKCTEEMKGQGLMLTSHIPSHVLSAFTLSGNVDEGQDLFKATAGDAIARPRIEHYNCAIDMFGRVGNLKDAEHMLHSMPIPADLVGWTALLTACTSHGDSTLGRQCHQQISQLNPNVSFGHSLLSKLYAEVDMLDDVHALQEQRKALLAWKKPGIAQIEVHTGVHEFIVQDESHAQSVTIYASLNRVTRLLKQQGYVPRVR